MPMTAVPRPVRNTVDDELVTTAHVLQQRAVSLRAQADTLPEALASAYSRRAAELELEAWVAEVQAGLPADEVHVAA